MVGEHHEPVRTSNAEVQAEKRLLLADVLPHFSTELQHLLTEKGEPELAAQVPGLMIFDRCRCGDNFCAIFYTQPKLKGSLGPKGTKPADFLRH
jgi:hypothetical protein